MDFSIDPRIDPRISVLEKRLSVIKRILVFASAKGGVGKSLCSTTSALLLSKEFKVGLLDLDFQGASDHLILGKEPGLPRENGGILPYQLVRNLFFMGVSLFSGDNPVPLRGEDTTNSILEILSVTIWDELDYLIIDMPPGIGEEILDLIRFLKRPEYIVISTPSILSESVVERFITILQQSGVEILGIIENMSQLNDEKNRIHLLAGKKGISYLGKIPYDKAIDSYIGNINKVLESKFAKELKEILRRCLWRQV